eukprot:snap_masked-scaffold_7-processed-gene-0.17-mRNA-1 protein AED:1.00 eAED:1.00 QI:0/0/0/0/1/1/2/0/764
MKKGTTFVHEEPSIFFKICVASIMGTLLIIVRNSLYLIEYSFCVEKTEGTNVQDKSQWKGSELPEEPKEAVFIKYENNDAIKYNFVLSNLYIETFKRMGVEESTNLELSALVTNSEVDKVFEKLEECLENSILIDELKKYNVSSHQKLQYETFCSEECIKTENFFFKIISDLYFNKGESLWLQSSLPLSFLKLKQIKTANISFIISTEELVSSFKEKGLDTRQDDSDQLVQRQVCKGLLPCLAESENKNIQRYLKDLMAELGGMFSDKGLQAFRIKIGELEQTRNTALVNQVLETFISFFPLLESPLLLKRFDIYQVSSKRTEVSKIETQQEVAMFLTKVATKVIDKTNDNIFASSTNLAHGCKVNSVGVLSCLPSVLVIGAQKASTDEFGVWLNFNKHMRRLNGGTETHFFDCMREERPEHDKVVINTWKKQLLDGGFSSIVEQRLAQLGNQVINTSWSKDRKVCHRKRASVPSSLTTPKQQKRIMENFSWNAITGNTKGFKQPMEMYRSLGRRLDTVSERQVRLFDKTPAYFDLADPKEVYNAMPNAKIILLLRNPVDRLYSAYFQHCRRPGSLMVSTNCTIERFANFFTSSKVQDSMDAQESLTRALIHGQYANHLVKWTNSYRPENVCVLFSTDFKRYPRAVMQIVEDFLRLPKPFHRYHPRKVNGYFTLGKYSKAYHSFRPPPLNSTKLGQEAQEILYKFYSKFNKILRKLLVELPFGCISNPQTVDKFEALTNSIPAGYFEGFSRKPFLSFPDWLANS